MAFGLRRKWYNGEWVGDEMYDQGKALRETEGSPRVLGSRTGSCGISCMAFMISRKAWTCLKFLLELSPGGGGAAEVAATDNHQLSVGGPDSFVYRISILLKIPCQLLRDQRALSIE
jgi:hypothetical protein